MENKAPLKIYISKNSAKALNEKEYVWDCNASKNIIDQGVWKIDIPYILESELSRVVDELKAKIQLLKQQNDQLYKDYKDALSRIPQQNMVK